MVDGLPRLATDVDLALLAPFDSPLTRPIERERLAADAVFAAFFSNPLAVFDAARALVLLRGDLERARLHLSAEDDARLVLAAFTERPLTDVDTAVLDLDDGRFADDDLGRPAGEQLRAAAALTEDLALLGTFDSLLTRPVERERLAAAAVFAAFFSIPLTVFDAARALVLLRGDLERARLQRSVDDDARLVLAALTERPLTDVDIAVLDLAGDFTVVTRAHFFRTGEARALDEGRFADDDLGRPAGEQLRAAAARFGVTLRDLLFDEPEPEDAVDVLRHGTMMSDARLNDDCLQTVHNTGLQFFL